MKTLSYVKSFNPIGFIIWALICIGMITGDVNPIFGIILYILTLIESSYIAMKIKIFNKPKY